jgi:hypothetical protein
VVTGAIRKHTRRRERANRSSCVDRIPAGPARQPPGGPTEARPLSCGHHAAPLLCAADQR